MCSIENNRTNLVAAKDRP
jgi:hypothetical protein